MDLKLLMDNWFDQPIYSARSWPRACGPHGAASQPSEAESWAQSTEMPARGSPRASTGLRQGLQQEADKCGEEVRPWGEPVSIKGRNGSNL